MIAQNQMPASLTHPIRQSLEARIARLLSRPVLAWVPRPEPRPAGGRGRVPTGTGLGIFGALSEEAARHAPRNGVGDHSAIWRTTDEDGDEDGSVRVRVAFDCDGADRGREKEIVEALQSVVRDEGEVVLLTSEQARLLRESPRAFVEMEARPEAVQLLGFKKDWYGQVERVMELELARGPLNPASIVAIAIMPNLVQLERQLDALDEVERAAVDGPLAPLRALLGLEADVPEASQPQPSEIALLPDERLDEHQLACVAAALATPHFTVVHGPPGAGKTTVISSIIRRLIDRGERVLVVSPTHVAIDNVVEKLTDLDGKTDDLHPATMPVRFATRPARLSVHAARYWAGNTKQSRSGTIHARVESLLRSRVDGAARWFDLISEDAPKDNDGPPKRPWLSSLLATKESVICGTPIGILTHQGVGGAKPGAFDTLIIDEVSKLTVPEFLAIAVKAKRWVLVGDPQQLPPHSDSTECAWTLRDLLDPALELVCSVAAVLEKSPPAKRPSTRLVVVTSKHPGDLAAAIEAHLQDAKDFGHTPKVLTLDEVWSNDSSSGILVCKASEVEDAIDHFDGDARVLAEIGLESRIDIHDDRLVGEADRAGARIFKTMFDVYHAQPWEKLARQKLPAVRHRKWIDRYLPSQAALDSFVASRDEHAMLKPVEGLSTVGTGEGHQLHITLINYTDTGYLISARALDTLFRGRVRYADGDGREWKTMDDVRTTPTEHEPYTVPLAPNGQREMVLSIAFSRIDPPEDPQQPGTKLPFPDKLMYAFQRPGQLLALPIQGNALGDEIRLRANGRGTCEVRFDGPM